MNTEIQKLNEAAFVQDCRAYNAGKSCVNPYVTSATSYGVPHDRVKPLLTENGILHPVFNPAKP